MSKAKLIWKFDRWAGSHGYCEKCRWSTKTTCVLPRCFKYHIDEVEPKNCPDFAAPKRPKPMDI